MAILHKLTRAQRAALVDATKRQTIFSYVPNSRYSHYEPGCHTHIVIRRLQAAGYLQQHPGGFVSGISIPVSYSITAAGRAALARKA